ncbi:MAG: tRNA (adenosine(37)-N6)-threonylcarbamoyltransferase complex dimerization subunit type 1 TsaB [Spirochaetota bacterium]
MNTLIIDTSTSYELVAAGVNGHVADMGHNAGISHSITLFDSIENALQSLGIKIQSIELLGVGIGPGSFTGIRIAVTTARMLAQVLSIPLVGIHSPMLYAASARVPAEAVIIVAFDAKKERVFGAAYRADATTTLPGEIIEPGDYHVEELLNAVPAGCPLYTMGNGIEKFMERGLIARPDLIHLPGFTPSGAASIRLLESIYAAHPNQYDDYSRVVPVYARKSDAEIVKELKKKKRET